MVKRYDSPRRRAKLLKDMPFYYRYPKEMMIIALLLPTVYVFGPPTFRFFFPPAGGNVLLLDPRREENLSKLRVKFLEREESLKDTSYFKDENK